MDHRCLLDTPEEELPSSRFRKAKVYVDCNSFGPRAIEAAVSLYGAERIVCGTDGTEFGCDWTRKALAEAQIGEEAREQILHRNAAAMLARVARTAQRETSRRLILPRLAGVLAHNRTAPDAWRPVIASGAKQSPSRCALRWRLSLASLPTLNRRLATSSWRGLAPPAMTVGQGGGFIRGGSARAGRCGISQ